MTFTRTAATLLLLSFTATTHGQDPADAAPAIAPPGVPIPGIEVAPAPEIPVDAAGAPVLNGNLGDTLITTDINEPKLTGSALAGLYRKYTGHRVIPSVAATTAEFSFVQEATPQDPLTFAQAAELLKKAATLENFVFVPDQFDPKLEYLTTSAGGIRPSGRGLPVFNETDTLPEGDAVISYVMNLNYIKPPEAVSIFTNIIGQFGAYGSIAPVPNASAIVITENTSLIRRLIDLKKEIDKPSAQVASRFIKVQFADVVELAEKLTTLLSPQQSGQTTAGVQRVGGSGIPDPSGINPGTYGANPYGVPGTDGGGGEAAPVQIIPDARTNRIFAMGRPIDILTVENLVREFDIETSEKNSFRRKLHFLTVSDFLPIAGDALARAFGGESTGGSGGGGASGTPGGAAANPSAGGNSGRSQSSNRSSSSGRSSGSSSGANFGGGSGSSSGGSGAGSALNAPETSSAPESLVIGRTLLVADNITNSIVVQGPPSGLEIVNRLLDQIDVRPDQVMISSVIGQLTLNDNIRSGIDYLRTGSDFVGRGGSGLGPILPILSRTPPFNPGSLAVGSGLQLYGKVGDSLNIYLTALQQKTDFTVLSRPSIFTSNNQKGTISSGERIAIPTSSNSFGSSGNASTNIEYQDVVLKLEVVPLVNSDKEITMEIALLSDEQNGTQTIAGAGSNGGDLTVPRISTREILTTVTVPNNETIVLGGLIVSRDNKDKTGIPILSDIPYLGGLFSTKTKNKDRSELMVFIQPSIVANDRNLNAVQNDANRRFDVSDRALDFAAGPSDVLPPLDSIPLDTSKPSASKNTTPSKSSIKPSVRRRWSH